MQTVTHLTPDFAVAGELSDADFEEAAASGFKAIINNRPDGEAPGQPTAASQKAIAEKHGLQYVHIPVNQANIFSDSVVGAMADTLAKLDGPILAHCKSGMRSAIVWAAASARTRPVAEVEKILSQGPFDLSFLHDELEQQAAHAAGTETA
ncbi:conserved protein of unknown function [Candidatus Filomicrobium marinum]|uniref:Beta-lactamase hydrolase-like protein phosphatase-like domain-containing protein n=1 Tax=Candidatus Filomicrobium marinum TaxID=1608628 RepID=A0A0D6JIZ7_9HYPH|nr:TIGR01244 family sulfur transferase [Candidatus Filomicrobium marinum]CFX33784.1 conserved protein of unknown function [Candidatus Filomicrobium marinum]CPR21896.1 conserved protein of unknown function [Candidatus Filomicrobium marinum]